jgi:hypothetical protein
MNYYLAALDKITSSIRKEVSKRLYTEYKIKKPVKSWVKGQGLSKIKAVHNGIEVTVSWCTHFISDYESESLELGQQVFVPCIETRKIDLSNYGDEYHPSHSWYSRGFGDGYAENAWNSNLEDRIPYPESFPDDEAEKAYDSGRFDGACQASLDE